MIAWSRIKEKYGYILQNAPVLAVTSIGSQLLGVLAIVYYGWTLGKEAYGVYSFILAMLGILAIASMIGMPSAILVGAAQGKIHILRSATRKRLFFSCVLGCPLMLIAAIAFLYAIPDKAMAGYACLILLPFFPFLYSFTGIVSYFNGRHEYWHFGLIQVIQALFDLVAVVTTITFWPKILFLPAVATAIGRAIVQGSAYIYAVRRDRIPLSREDAHLISYGYKITLTGVTGSIESHVDRFLVGLFFPWETTGLFSAGRAILPPLRQLAMMYYQLFTPRLARQTPAEALRDTNRMLVYGLVVIIPGAVAAYFLLPLAYLLLGKLHESASFARLFLIAFLAAVPWYFYYAFFRSQRLARREIIVLWTKSLTLAIGLVVFGLLYKEVGFVYAEIVSFGILSIQSWYMAQKSRAV